MTELDWKCGKEIDVHVSSVPQVFECDQSKPYRQEVGRDLQFRSEGEKPQRPQGGCKCKDKGDSPKRNRVRKCSQHETCFSRDYGRVFRVSFLTKHSKPLRAGKVRMGRLKRATPRKKIADIKQQFTAFRQQCVSNYAVPKKSHKTKVVKVPYSLPMKFVTLNFRGVNGDSGILKRQRLVRVMSEQKYDVVPLSEIQVNSSSFEASRDCLFFFSSDVLPEQADREHAGVGIGAH